MKALDDDHLLLNESRDAGGAGIGKMDGVDRKIVRHVVPVCFATTIISYVHRADLGLAARELCAENSYATGVSHFFVFYPAF